MPTITSQIVQVNTTVTEAPAPSQLQQSGALVSVGGTTLTTGTSQYCGTLAAVVAILSSSGNFDEIEDMASTYFAQGNAVGVYILELGVEGSSSAGITALGAWITANPGVFYAYLLPAAWDASGAAINTLAANYSSPTGKTYFFVTTTINTISAYAPTSKAIIATVPSPTAAAEEFQAAALFYQWLANSPSAVSPVPPMGYRFLFGVTPWVATNNQTQINEVLTAYGNVILTGAEGGISTATLFKGTTMDGNQSMFWWAVDWVQIQAKQLLAAAIINGSNENPPLYYNQNGINQLLAILQDIGSTGIAFGLLLTAKFASVPFTIYTQQNPSNYAAGIYNGFSATVTPQTGFLTITFNLDATAFVPAAP
jgi:hypothetical protein